MAPASRPSLSEKVLLLETGFAGRRIPHAFGGAIALAYYATPRTTIDIDVNVFLPVERADEALSVLETLGAAPLPDEARRQLARDGQARVPWDRTPIDLFFAYDPFHERCLEQRRLLPFGEGDRIHVLAPEDLLVFKTLFDRGKDRRDVDELLYAMGSDLDAAAALTWLDRILGPEDERVRRVREVLARLP